MHSVAHPVSRSRWRRSRNALLVGAVSAALVMIGSIPAVAAPGDVDATMTANANFDRTYLWDIATSVDDAVKDAQPDGMASFDYLVEAIPDGFVDSGWELTGDITVVNYTGGPLMVNVTSPVGLDGGADCAVVGGVNAILPPGATDFPYSCTFTSRPTYSNSIVATIAWGPDTYNATTLADFTLDGETDTTVTVVDDKADPANQVTLGTATWNAAGTPVPFTYTLTHEIVGNSCTTFTSRAWLVENGIGDSIDAQVCPAPAATPQVLPRTGPDGVGPTIVGSVSIALGGVLLMAARRRLNA